MYRQLTIPQGVLFYKEFINLFIDKNTLVDPGLTSTVVLPDSVHLTSKCTCVFTSSLIFFIGFS